VGTTPISLTGPGFIAVILDVPFPVSISPGAYHVFDPVKQIAAVEVSVQEGSKTFFRSRPIQGPTSFTELQTAWANMERRDRGTGYLMVSRMLDGNSKATLNLHTGHDGGYAECKYYSRVSVTFLADDIAIINSNQNAVQSRAFQILNPFLDKYRLLNEDYRISPVTANRNFYLAVCHTSPLTLEERSLSTIDLFNRLASPRTFFHSIGHGAANILRVNSYELLGPRSPLADPIQSFFEQFVQGPYEMPLSYALVLESLANLQRTADYRLAIIHAETAVEVHFVNRLIKLMVEEGMAETDAVSTIETDGAFWGVKKKIRQLDSYTRSYSTRHGLNFTPFVGSPLYDRWESDLYRHRNNAVHAGENAFTYDQAHRAIGTAKECIVNVERRVPTLADRIQLSVSMAGFRPNPGEVAF